MKFFKYILVFLFGCTSQSQKIDIFYTPKNSEGIQFIYILDVDEILLAEEFRSRYNGKEWHFILCQ